MRSRNRRPLILTVVPLCGLQLLGRTGNVICDTTPTGSSCKECIEGRMTREGVDVSVRYLIANSGIKSLGKGHMYSR